MNILGRTMRASITSRRVLDSRGTDNYGRLFILKFPLKSGNYKLR